MTTNLIIHSAKIGSMAEAHIHKNLADKRKEIQAYIGSLERNLEQARSILP